MLAAAATNQNPTNARVAVVIAELLELANSLATPRQPPHRIKPKAMMNIVRMPTSFVVPS
jgi:hypothetical protein